MSLMQRIKEVETQISTILALQDLDNLSPAERPLVAGLKHQAIDSRLEVRDYEYADTRLNQLSHAKSARKLLQQLEDTIVKASEYGLFSAVDVAQITAQIDGIATDLE